MNCIKLNNLIEFPIREVMRVKMISLIFALFLTEIVCPCESTSNLELLAVSMNIKDLIFLKEFVHPIIGKPCSGFFISNDGYFLTALHCVQRMLISGWCHLT